MRSSSPQAMQCVFTTVLTLFACEGLAETIEVNCKDATGGRAVGEISYVILSDWEPRHFKRSTREILQPGSSVAPDGNHVITIAAAGRPGALARRSRALRIIVFADSFAPYISEWRDSPAGNRSLLHFDARMMLLEDASRQVVGKVVDSSGKPLPYAILRVIEHESADAIVAGPIDGEYIESSTDAVGRFVIQLPESVQRIRVSVDHPLAVPVTSDWIKTGSRGVDIQCSAGASVLGKVTPNPNSRLIVRMVPVGVKSIHKVCYETICDEDGSFRFDSIPVDRDFLVSIVLSDCVNKDSYPIVPVRTGNAGGVFHMAPLRSEPIATLDLTLSALPGNASAANARGTKLRISRVPMLDAIDVDLVPDQSKRLNLPAGRYRIGIASPGFRLSSKNYSLDPIDGDVLIGRIDSHTRLRIDVEPGNPQSIYDSRHSSMGLWRLFDKRKTLQSQVIRGR